MNNNFFLAVAFATALCSLTIWNFSSALECWRGPQPGRTVFTIMFIILALACITAAVFILFAGVT